MPSCTEEDLHKFTNLLPHFDSLFYKSLSRNDHQWAEEESSHQSGVLIPRKFLPFFCIKKLPENNFTKDLDMIWFLEGEEKLRSDMTHTGGHNQTHIKFYIEGNRASRPEAHLTCVYNPYFKGLHDGAIFVVGRKRNTNDREPKYYAIIIDSQDDDLIEELHQFTEIPSGPSWGIIRSVPEDESEFKEFDLPPLLIKKLRERAADIYRNSGSIPSTSTITDTIWELVRKHQDILEEQIRCRGITQTEEKYRTAIKNAPGNLIRWMLQNVEFLFFKFFEKLHYPSVIIDHIRNQKETYPEDWDHLEHSVANSLDDIVETAKSITQSRRSRAGQSFQNHISSLLEYHRINYEPESGERRIDFVIRNGDDIKLSAKTSIRERWKQVYTGSYFITLDRQVTESKLESIKQKDIKLVVPEEDKTEIRHYRDDSAVLSISEFMGNMIQKAG